MTDSPGDLLRQSLGQLKPNKIALAFSGGADSTALLIAASTLSDKQKVVAYHVNHGIHPKSSLWADHCIAIAASLRVACQVLEVPPGRLPLSPNESQLRDMRYQLLRAQLGDGDILLTAHHRDDVAESVLLAALRGGSSHELAGIPALRPLGRGLLCRPWLSLAKDRLVEVVVGSGLKWIEDPSNHSLDVRRSFVRQQVLPVLMTRWPDAKQSLAATSVRQTNTANALDELLDQLLPTPPNRMLAGSLLDSVSEQTQAFVVQRWLVTHSVSLPSARQIEELLAQRTEAAQDRQPHLSVGGLSLRCYRQNLFLVEDLSSSQPPISWAWDCVSQPQLKLPDGSLLHCDAPARFSGLTVQTASPGQKIMRAGEDHHRVLNKVFQTLGVPPWVRAQVPLIFEADELIQIGNYWRVADPRHLDHPLTWIEAE